MFEDLALMTAITAILARSSEPLQEYRLGAVLDNLLTRDESMLASYQGPKQAQTANHSPEVSFEYWTKQNLGTKNDLYGCKISTSNKYTNTDQLCLGGWLREWECAI